MDNKLSIQISSFRNKGSKTANGDASDTDRTLPYLGKWVAPDFGGGGPPWLEGGTRL